jgi:PAS domain S-box-containing protein
MPPSAKPSRARARKSSAPPRATPRDKIHAALVQSEAELRATLYSIGDAVIATDAQGRVARMNPVAEQLTGWREAEARGKPLAEVFRIVNEETRAPVQDPVTRVLREGTVIGLANHTLLLARDGREISIADAGAPIHDARGKIVGVVLVFRDQTAERAAQRAVQEAREYAESIVATVRDPLIVLDNDLRVVTANRAFYRVFATTPEETEGRLLYELGNRQWDIPELRRLLGEILPQNTAFNDYAVTHDFERIGPRTMLLNARRLHREGKADLILLAIEDITARKQRERELETLQQVSSALRQARTVEEMIPIFVQHAVQAVGADAGSIYLLEESSGDWVARGWLNARGEWLITSSAMRHRANEGVTGRVGATGEIYITEDWRTDAVSVVRPEEEPLLRVLHGGISLPLRTEARSLGVMHIWYAQPHTFTDEERRLLTAIADMAGNSLQRAHLYEQASRRAEKIAAVNALGRALAATLDVPTLCRIAHQHIRTLVACDNLSITLYDNATRTLRPAFVISEEQELDVMQFPPLTIDPNAPRAGRAQAILDAQTVVINDLLEKARQSGRMIVGSETVPQSAVYTPMLVEGKVIGLLELQSYRNHAYTADDLDLLSMLANQMGLAIQNARLFDETRARLNELNTLHQASQILLTSTLDLEATCTAIHQAIARVMPCEALSIVLEDEAQGDYHGVYLYDKSGRVPAQRVPRGAGLSGRVIPSGNTLVIDDYAAQTEIRAMHFGDPEHTRSILAVPLRRGDKTIGMVATQAYQQHAFTREHRVLLETLAAQFATSIENARLYEQTRARLRELQAIAAVSAALSAASTRAEMYAAILDQLGTQLDLDGASIEMLDPESGDLTTELGRGVWASVTGMRIPRGKGLSAQVLATGKPYLNNDARNDPRLFRPDAFGDCRAAAGVPMRIGSQTLGLLWIASRRALTEDDVRLLTAIADIAANALHRAALNEQTERQVRQLSTLRAIDRVISSSFDLRVTLGVILEHTVAELGVDAVSVLVQQPHLHTLEHVASRGFLTRAIERTRLRVGESFAGRVALERQIVHVPDLVARANGFIVKELAAEGYTEYYGVPLIAKGNVVGVMEIFNRAPLPRDAEWRAFCETLAGQAAIAIDNARLFTDLQRSHTDLMLAYDATIEGWSRALELRDQETEGHTERVTEITLRLARAFGIGEEEITHIRRGALLHDIGKISIPDAILLKPGKLTDEEMALMRGHAQRAYEMLLPIEYLRPALDIPYCHHEKWDGTGYPRGLKGEEIPLAARLFAIADVYDALTSDRPYRKAWSRAEALEYIRQQSGTYFEPRVVEVFLQIVGEGG